VRHDSAGGTLRFGGLPLNPEDRVARVLRGDLPRVERATTDYRGEGVWLAARAVPGIGWGVLVKIDESERRDPMLAFRAQTIRLALALSAFAIMLGFLFGFRLAQPIHLLAEAANRIRDGELHARSNIEREDEVGLLARTFDQMASKLEEQVGLLTEFRKFFDVSIDMMCIAHTDGTFKRVNPAFSRELGWSEDELLSRPFMDLVHPDDLGATVHEIDKLSTGRPTISFENRFLCKDGSFRRLRWNSYPEPETGLLYALARVQSTPAGEAP
jgi:PAS domain S-box-containing protein